MEFSSPLAAMQPPPRPWGFGRDIPNSRPQHAASSRFGGSDFNFRDMSMKRSQSDYFSLKAAPLRGSSPTASLAADLSQNFHIDQSPQLPTPRRSLFTAGIFNSKSGREGATTPPIYWESATTPPIPSSSPGYPGDSMDISPLPHKVPFSFAHAPKVQPPTTESMLDEDMISTSEPVPNTLLEVPQNVQVPQRKRSSLFSRPSLLSRAKCLSTNSIPQQPKVVDSQLPAFTFGAGGKGLIGSSSISSLDECFQPSPPQEKNPFDSTLCGSSRSRSLFGNANASNRANGSPINVQVKRNPIRPRKQVRRSLSMFEHPADVLKQEKEYVPSGLQSIMDIDEIPTPKLPHFFSEDEDTGNCSLPRIGHETLINILDGGYKHVYDRILVVDCRFEYEYEGGHIQGASNFNSKEQLAQDLFSTSAQANTLIIFHCEFSKCRAPLMATYIRQQDRAVNAADYPRLTYPEVYILHGGYSAFFESHGPRCFPQNYVLMNDDVHKDACERGLYKIKQKGGRQKLNRAVTFAFGQSCKMEDSPSRASPSGGQSVMEMDLAPSRMHTRRMASY